MANSKISVENLNLHYGENHALKDVNMEIADHAITAFIGPSGCGKSTFLRCLNRMNDLVDGCRVEGKVILDGEDIYDKRVDTTLPRWDCPVDSSRDCVLPEHWQYLRRYF